MSQGHPVQQSQSPVPLMEPLISWELRPLDQQCLTSQGQEAKVYCITRDSTRGTFPIYTPYSKTYESGCGRSKSKHWMMIWNTFDPGHLTIAESSKGHSIICQSLLFQGDGEHGKTRELQRQLLYLIGYEIIFSGS